MLTSLIAEIGSNHCGDLELALEHIVVAAESGVNHVKFQYWDVERLYPNDVARQRRLRPYQLPLDWLSDLQATAAEVGVSFGLSVFHAEDVPVVAPFCDFLKIASLSLRYHSLIRAAAAEGLPLYLSAGAANSVEVQQAAWAAGWSGSRGEVVPLIFHCVAEYPTPPAHLNLRQITTLKTHFGRAGYSDHAVGYDHLPLAVALGAEMIEKHFCLPLLADTRLQQSPDAPHSLPSDQWPAMVATIAAAEEALGSSEKTISDAESRLSWAQQTDERPYRDEGKGV